MIFLLKRAEGGTSLEVKTKSLLRRSIPPHTVHLSPQVLRRAGAPGARGFDVRWISYMQLAPACAATHHREIRVLKSQGRLGWCIRCEFDFEETVVCNADLCET